MFSHYAAYAVAVVACCMIIFQVMLAAGLPFGRAAWGGQHDVLPARLRVGSLLAGGILTLAAWVVLARAGIASPGADASIAVRIATWVFGGFFCLNTLGNLASKSPTERKVMTPVTVLLAVCCFTVALS